MKILIVGAGFSGAVIADYLVRRSSKLKRFEVTVIDQRSHVGGNCYTEIDQPTGIIEHVYGPHIFHTDDESVWKYVNEFTTFKPYVNRVKTTSKGTVYSLPVNLHTINQFYNTAFTPDVAKKFISDVAHAEKLSRDIGEPQNFEEQAISMIGSGLYEAFFKGYTEKQWGMDPKKLPASILKRLPLRFNYDDNYFFHKYQGMPEFGYTPIFEKMLEGVDVRLNTKFDHDMRKEYDHIFFSGKIDEWFNYDYGDLPYRTLRFVKNYHDTEDQLGTAVMNFGDENIAHTRISEHKHFSPWKIDTKNTFTVTEFSRQAKRSDIPYYPIRMVDDKETLSKYEELAKHDKKVTFVGRLGTYQYLDMDVTIKNAMEVATSFIKRVYFCDQV